MTAAILAILLQSQRGTDFLAVDGLLIGYRQSGAWHGGAQLRSKKMPITFRHIGLGSSNDSYRATGLTVETNGPEGVYLEGPDKGREGVLFSGSATFPRPVKVLSNQNETYLKVLGTFLRGHGIRSKPRLTRVISADLDGDGSDEVILEASNRDDLTTGGMHGGRFGDYSILLLRFVKDGKVIEYPLEFDHPKAEEMPYVNKIVAIADLDGDGTMELVRTSNYYEGSGAFVERYHRGKVSHLAQNGSGA